MLLSEFVQTLRDFDKANEANFEDREYAVDALKMRRAILLHKYLKPIYSSPAGIKMVDNAFRMMMNTSGISRKDLREVRTNFYTSTKRVYMQFALCGWLLKRAGWITDQDLQYITEVVNEQAVATQILTMLDTYGFSAI
jgi:hypothetical protein